MKAMSARSARAMLFLALALTCTNLAHAQSFKKVSIKGGAKMMQVASGATSAWALAANGNPYIFKGKSFALANSISLSQIAVGGGSLLQADTVWGLDATGRIFKAVKSGTTWTFSQVPGSLTVIEVGPGYQDACHPYEVWGLDSGSQIYRYNFCGATFEQVPGILCDIKVGGGDIWGPQCSPNVFRFNFRTGVFDQISNPFGAFPALTVGPNGEVWATDTGNSLLYRYDPFADGFVLMTSAVRQVQAGGDGVWVLVGRSQQVLRWQASDPGFRQVQSPVSVASLSVGSGAGVFGLDSTGQVFAFSTP